MIAAWMLAAGTFALCCAVAAACGERALRAIARQARGCWAAAIAVAVVWPVVARVAGPNATAAILPAIRVSWLVPGGVSAVGTGWTHSLSKSLPVLWALTSAVLLLRLVVMLVRARRLRDRAERRIVDGVELLVSETAGPAVVGLVRPEIVFSGALLSLDAALRGMIVRHEEEHRRAGDAWLMLGCALAEVAMPWNPALWWMTSRMRLALEMDCDARVLRGGASPTLYGKLLLLVAQADARTHLAPALVPSRWSRTHLERRIHLMLTAPTSRRTLRIVTGVAGVVLASIAACSSNVTDGSGPASGGVAQAVSPDKSFFEFQVDQPARIVDGSYFLKYPDALKANPKAGSALVQYVVTAEGTMLPGSLKVLQASDPAFIPSIRDALAMARFTPARAGGRPVRQLLQQPWEFPLPPTP